MIVTPEYLRARLNYCPDTGQLTWKAHESMPKRWNTRWSGKVAGKLTSRGYLQVRVLGRLYLGHRVAWAIATGGWPTGVIDHIDGDCLNNALENLRSVTQGINSKNRLRNANNTSGVTGVKWNKSRKKWMAALASRHLGYFTSLEAASAARLAAEAEDGQYTERHGTTGATNA